MIIIICQLWMMTAGDIKLKNGKHNLETTF